ncbi:MAG: Gfo/Idh/MocA family oxidoreductase [Planctomycetia bacterium]|nr:Gfo/Idh/MocA family oxidoreductase [Planctomycetia bacterium]
MSLKTNRRTFLKSTAVAGAGVMIVSDLLAQESPNEKIAFACVGIGGKGSSDSADAARFGQVVAVCDTNRKQLKGGEKRFPGCKVYEDYRKMFDEMGKSIDAVTVSTPDHMHAPIAAMAMKLGKHVYCQKPLTRTISEARKLAQIAKENGVVTQMGNQTTATTPSRECVALVQNGLIGTVKKVISWSNRPVWPQGGERGPEAPVPDYLNWDCWIGSAPMRPFVNGAYDPFAWRGWWDFGCGALGDMGCHQLSVLYRATDLKNPVSVQAKTSGHNFDSLPKWSVIDFVFPDTSERPGFVFTWLDGGQRPDPELLEGETMSGSGFLLIGDKGTMFSPDGQGASRKILGPARDQEKALLDKIRPEIRVASNGHFGEFVEAVKMNDPTFPMMNMITTSGGLTETILLGNLAVWAANKPEEMGEKIEWDAANLRLAGNPTDRERLESLIFPKYREGYTM